MYELQHHDIDGLVSWYRLNKRSFPWRDTGDPFDVWISEIMLQQTRTEAVIAYFNRFREKIGNIDELALIDEEKLLRLWEGLGYYSRARNLKKCASILKEEYGSRIPDDYRTLLSLPGIGPYTAGAIMSIGFGRPYPAIDGNVLRVLSRYFAIREDIRLDHVRKTLEESVSSFYRKHGIIDPSYISDLSQAFMDLGATICIPNGTPLCKDCPLKGNCRAHILDLTGQIPYRSKNKERKVIERTLFIIRNGDTFLLHKRGNRGLLAGLYEFAGVDEPMKEEDVFRFLKEEGYDVLRIRKLPDARHVFTHLEWHMNAYEIKIGSFDVPLKQDEVLVSVSELQDLAIPSAFRTYIDYYALRKDGS